MSPKMSNKTIVVASSNKHKIEQLKIAAKDFKIELIDPIQCQKRYKLSEPPEVEETADTYQGNAKLKAEAFFKWSGVPSLGDDSGIEVAVLGDRPGIYSARYGGVEISSAERANLLLQELEQTLFQKNSNDRRARFRCYLVLALDGGFKEAEGILEGEILTTPRGDKGFGYDPIVKINSTGKTLAETGFSDTSHRGIAARKLFVQLQNY
jgi:XTP/dITP diphosphohydrolase